ncbi:MAG TPA: 4-alpha-glucanotransferase [Verrucomicrobiae bacterium]|nr:4-alpha-glucanotransferase [Verrucomicrobiae bacterium]
MKLTFRLRFHTNIGQSLSIVGNHERLGQGSVENAMPLHYVNDEFWEVIIAWPSAAALRTPISYTYVLRNADGSILEDWGKGRSINLTAYHAHELLVIDSWNRPGFYENAFYTEPFQEVLLKADQTEVRTPVTRTATHTFKVKAPLLAKGQTLCLLGETKSLGKWSTAKPVLLNRIAGEDYLSVQVNLSRETFPIEYKYGVCDAQKKTLISYEEGTNRVLDDTVDASRYTIVNDGFVRLPSDTWRAAGVAIPVFSLRSEGSFGVGEFTDLKLLADWAHQVGLKLIQVLPINDTSATHTWKDSYPYAAISAFALHPLYLNLDGVVADENRPLLKKLEPERKRLNQLDALEYEAVMKAKLGFLRQIYPSQGKKVFASKDYQRFFADNQHWLVPYAAFCYLRDKYGTPDFNQWPTNRTCQPSEIAKLVAEDSPGHDEIAFNFFIQYHLHVQLREAAQYAHSKGVVLKGDIAIGVYRFGADAWQQPELFHMDIQAGAPPDAFAAKGQNWGFPTYNWPRMRQDGFAWWKRRFQQMSCYFDAFRIDHILGFFRIWSIPAHAVEGILGYFVPAIPVQAEELIGRGIDFDPDRYAKPFITDPVLKDVFGKYSGPVKRDFLNGPRAGRYSLKPNFATQRQVEQYFAKLEPTDANKKIQQGLYDLISNVILLTEEGSHRSGYHFRLGIESTSSFRNLPPHSQQQLRELYVDYFFRRQENFWTREAMQKLPALKRVTNMLICGEDLGMVPDCVPGVMKKLGLLSLEVQRMPKKLNQDFSRPAEAPYLSVVTPSTHDMSTIRGWWEEDRNFTQRFYNSELGQCGEAPAHCTGRISKTIVLQHLSSPAMWSIFQMQDLLGMDEKLRRKDIAAERINIPAIIGYYWRYRMHLTLEKLQQAQSFNRELKNCIAQCGR